VVARAGARAMRGLSRRELGLGLLASLALACRRGPPKQIVVIGGGPAGLAAAFEAARGGATVRVLERGREVGGAALYGQAITALPGAAGLAWWDEAAGRPNVARERYVGQVQAEVVDFLTERGVQWGEAWNPKDDGAVLVQPQGGGRAVVGALGAAAAEAGVEIRTKCEVVDLKRVGAGFEIVLEGKPVETLAADAVVLATGGFMGDPKQVLERLGLPSVSILRGAPRSADGAGLVLGEGVGGAVRQPSEAILYAHGIEVDRRAVMLIEANRGWPVSPAGEHLPWLRSPRGESGQALAAIGGEAWVIVDSPALKGMSMWDWQARKMLNAGQLVRATGFPVGSLAELAEELGVPLSVLEAGVRLSDDPKPTGPRDLVERPLVATGSYAALPARVTTAKSLTGLETDLAGRVLDAAGAVVPGLFAAGEVAGFGHPYDNVPYDSTMVAGAVLTGRISGRSAAAG